MNISHTRAGVNQRRNNWFLFLLRTRRLINWRLLFDIRGLVKKAGEGDGKVQFMERDSSTVILNIGLFSKSLSQ